MISRLLVFGLLYVAMFLGWIGVGLFMLLAPARFLQFVRDNVGPMVEGRRSQGGELFIRIVGAGFIAFALRFALGVADLFRTHAP